MCITLCVCVCVTSYRILSHEFTWPYVVAGANKLQEGQQTGRRLEVVPSSQLPPVPLPPCSIHSTDGGNPALQVLTIHQVFFAYAKVWTDIKRKWENLLNLIWMCSSCCYWLSLSLCHILCNTSILSASISFRRQQLLLAIWIFKFAFGFWANEAARNSFLIASENPRRWRPEKFAFNCWQKGGRSCPGFRQAAGPAMPQHARPAQTLPLVFFSLWPPPNSIS